MCHTLGYGLYLLAHLVFITTIKRGHKILLLQMRKLTLPDWICVDLQLENSRVDIGTQVHLYMFSLIVVAENSLFRVKIKLVLL
jgi:hypothetical protein